VSRSFSDILARAGTEPSAGLAREFVDRARVCVLEHRSEDSLLCMQAAQVFALLAVAEEIERARPRPESSP
jgi:hypothetical protein